jgi:hypothetical protein
MPSMSAAGSTRKSDEARMPTVKVQDSTHVGACETGSRPQTQAERAWRGIHDEVRKAISRRSSLMAGYSSLWPRALGKRPFRPRSFDSSEPTVEAPQVGRLPHPRPRPRKSRELTRIHFAGRYIEARGRSGIRQSLRSEQECADAEGPTNPQQQ